MQWRRVVWCVGYMRSYSYPPLYPTLFFGMGIGLRVNSEDAPYSAQGVSFAVEWVAALIWACTWAVIIEEMDVSNGPESGRNLAVISVPRTASLCHGRSYELSGVGHEKEAGDQLQFVFRQKSPCISL